MMTSEAPPANQLDVQGTLVTSFEEVNALAANGTSPQIMYLDPSVAPIMFYDATDRAPFLTVEANTRVHLLCNNVFLVACKACTTTVFIEEGGVLELRRCQVVGPMIPIESILQAAFGLKDPPNALPPAPPPPPAPDSALLPSLLPPPPPDAAAVARRALLRSSQHELGAEEAFRRLHRALLQDIVGTLDPSMMFQGKGCFQWTKCSYKITCTSLAVLTSLVERFTNYQDYNVTKTSNTSWTVNGEIYLGEAMLQYDEMLIYCDPTFDDITLAGINSTTPSAPMVNRTGSWPMWLIILLCFVGFSMAVASVVYVRCARRRSKYSMNMTLNWIRSSPSNRPTVSLSSKSLADDVITTTVVDSPLRSRDLMSQGPQQQLQALSQAPFSLSNALTAALNTYSTAELEAVVDPETYVAAAIKDLKQDMGTGGDVGGGHLQIHGVIAQGGFGTVYLGTWRCMPVAIKTVLFQGVRGGKSTLRRAAAEASIAYNLSHPNIVATYTHEIGPVDKEGGLSGLSLELVAWKLYLIQELCNGGTLRRFVEAGMMLGPMQVVRLDRALQVLLDIALGMEHVHSKRIVHGDLSPTNVLLHTPFRSEPFGEGGCMSVAHRAAESMDRGQCTAKIADFGLSMHLNINKSHISNVLKGTPFYCAPELAQDKKLLPASDVYSYGVIMWEVLHSCLPFFLVKGIYQRHRLFGQFAAHIPLVLSRLANACLDQKPCKRPSFTHIKQQLLLAYSELSTGWYIDSKRRRRPSRNVGCENIMMPGFDDSQRFSQRTLAPSGSDVSISIRFQNFDNPAYESQDTTAPHTPSRSPAVPSTTSSAASPRRQSEDE